MSAMDAPQRWPLVTDPLNRAASTLQDGRLINCYAELNKQTKEFDVIKRAGWEQNGSYTNTVGFVAEGFFAWYPLPAASAPDVLSIVAQSGAGPTRLFNYNTYVQDVSGLISPTPQRWDFVPLNDNPSTLFMKQVNNGYVWDGAVATAIADAAYVSFQSILVPGAAYLNSRIYVATYENDVYNSSNNDDATVWNTLDVIKANNTVGYALGIVRHLQYILVFKGSSTEPFYDAGNPSPGSPLSRVDGVRIPFGLTSFNTVKSYNDVLHWVGQAEGSIPSGVDYRVIQMRGLDPSVISTPYIERLLIDGLYGNIVTFAGHRFYTLWGFSNELSLWYDIDQGVWSEMYGVLAIFNSVEVSGFMFYQYYNGAVYQLTTTKYYDFTDQAIETQIYTPNIDFGLDREKFLSGLYFAGDQVTGSLIQVRYSDDDYQTWSQFRQVDLSQKRPALWDEGSFYRRAYHLYHVANTPMRLRALGLQLDVGVL